MVREKWFLPIALGLCIAGGFATWYAFSDYERARYYGAIVGIPGTMFMLLAVLGKSGEIRR